ncbi:hypothetical protein BJX63DRAFT_416554 [Aspergillus granulosus]|uniref:Uncharacterized protein n=1 Tax=Aspergillus granulosus TaxID=176169 RepID=A0ABR4GRW7_9EURO
MKLSCLLLLLLVPVARMGWSWKRGGGDSWSGLDCDDCCHGGQHEKGVLLHKLIVAELVLVIFHGPFIFLHAPAYSWYLSITVIGLNASWSGECSALCLVPSFGIVLLLPSRS